MEKLEKLEKVREFLYDLDKIRKNLDAVHDLIRTFNGMSVGGSESESEGLEFQIDIGELDGSDIQIWVTVDGQAESVWIGIDEDLEDDLLRIEKKEGEVIFKTKI